MVSMWRHGGGGWHKALFLAAASNVKSPADVTDDFRSTESRLWQAYDTENTINGLDMGPPNARATQSRIGSKSGNEFVCDKSGQTIINITLIWT